MEAPARCSVRGVLAGVMMMLAALLGPSIAQAQCGQDYHGTPASSSVPGGPPLAIGDSVLADAVPLLVRDGFEADGMVCRQMSQGIELLEGRAQRLPHLVVLALGTNGEVTEAQIERALAILGPTRVLALVTPHGSVVPSTPNVIRDAAARDPGRIVLVEWDKLAEEHPSWLAPDGVHLGGEAGIEGYARMIAALLPYALPSNGAGTETGTPSGGQTATEAAVSGEAPTGAPVTLAPPPAKRAKPAARAKEPHAKAPATPASNSVGSAARAHKSSSTDGGESAIIAVAAVLLLAAIVVGVRRLGRR